MMRRTTLAVCCVALGALLWPASAQEANAEKPKPLANDEEKTFYALGAAIGRNLTMFNLTEAEFAFVMRGIADSAFKRKHAVDLATFMPKVRGLAESRRAASLKLEEVASAKFCQEHAAKPGAVTTESGLIYTEIKAGGGASPRPNDVVKVHYHGTLRDGKVFDSSVDRGVPATFRLKQVINAWQEGLQLMKVGGKARLVCPAELAYGADGRPGIPPGAALVFEVELLEIITGR